MNKSWSKVKNEIIKEAVRIEKDVLHASKCHATAARIWRWGYLWLGIPTIFFSVVTTGLAYSKIERFHTFTWSLSIIVSILAALMTYLNPHERHLIHLSYGNKFKSLYNQIRIFRVVDCINYSSEDILVEKLRFYAEQNDKLHADSPQISWLAYKISHIGIEDS